MMPIVRVGDDARNPADSHGCPKCPHDVRGPAKTGSPNVEVNSRKVVRVCDSGIHRTCCGDGTWKAVEGAATVFANGKSVVRKGDRSLHCGGGGNLIEGSASVVVGGRSRLAVKDTPAETVVAYIHDEMVTNARGPHADWLRERTSLFEWRTLIPGAYNVDYTRALIQFGILVWPETQKTWLLEHLPKALRDDVEKDVAIWDHKARILEMFGGCAYDPTSGKSFRYDVWSNIHYGYVGRASGIGSVALKEGAGFGQIAAQTSDVGSLGEYVTRGGGPLERFDDPEDQAAIDAGIDLWEKRGHQLTEEDVLDAIRGTPGLSPCPKLSLGCR